MVDEFTHLNLDKHNGESEIFSCSRCNMMMSIIHDRLGSFFSELTTKITCVDGKNCGVKAFMLQVLKK